VDNPARPAFSHPTGRDIIHFDLTINQCAFNLIAQHNMRRITHFIGIDANVARLHALVPGNKVLFAKGGLAAETGMYGREQMFQEGVTATKLHFKEQALGFVDCRGARQRDGLTRPGTRQVLLIAGMTGFVNHAKQRAQQFVFVIARGDTHIFWHAAAERVRANVQTTGVKIEAEHFHGFQTQLPLIGGREGALRRDKRRWDCFSTTFASRSGSQDFMSANSTSRRALVMSGSKISSRAS
jgi:hypothetical protein